MKLANLSLFVAATMALNLILPTAFADNNPPLELNGTLRGTLKKIKGSGKITLGILDSSIPFSYLDDQQIHQGYGIDLCKKVVDAVSKQLVLPNLKIVMHPVTQATRIPLMANGTVDLDCGPTANTPERQKQVTFGLTTFITGSGFLAKKTSHITGLANLAGKTVTATSGGSNLKQLVTRNANKNWGMKIIPSKDFSEAFLMVETGRAAAFFTNEILLVSLVAASKKPADYVIIKDDMSVEPYALMMRKGDPQFKKTVDEAINDLFKSGEIKTIYDKWFMKPIPPKGINLNWPMSESLKAVIAKPTDSSDPSAYLVAAEEQIKRVNKKNSAGK